MLELCHCRCDFMISSEKLSAKNYKNFPQSEISMNAPEIKTKLLCVILGILSL